MVIACLGQLALQAPQPLHKSSSTCATPLSFSMAPKGQITMQRLQPVHRVSSTTALSVSHNPSLPRHSVHVPHSRHLRASNMAASLILAKSSSASSKLTFCFPTSVLGPVYLLGFFAILSQSLTQVVSSMFSSLPVLKSCLFK